MSGEGYIGVVVVLFNSSTVLPGLAHSLPEALAGVRARIVAVDNASADDSVHVTRSLIEGVHVVEAGRNGGYAAAINAGIEAAGDVTAILVLNPDTRLAPGSVRVLLDALDEPGTGIAVPRLLGDSGQLLHSLRREPTIGRELAGAILGSVRVGSVGTWGETVTDSQTYEESSHIDWAEGSVQLISRECVDRVGPWDESFFMYSEETDFDLRARDAGLRTRYVPGAAAVHLRGGSSTHPGLWALLVTNKVRLYRKRRGRFYAASCYLVLLGREATRAVNGRATSRAAVRALLAMPRSGASPGPSTVQQYANPKVREWLRK